MATLSETAIGLDAVARQVLASLTTNPWMSASATATHAALAQTAVEKAICMLETQGYVQREHACQPAPGRDIFATTESGVRALVGGRDDLLRSLRKHTQLSARRYEWLRLARELVHWTNEVCASSTQAARASGGGAEWQTLIPRKRKRSHIMLHGRLVLFAGDSAQAWHVLIDPGWGDVARYKAVLQYLGAWHLRYKHAHPVGVFPGLLVITRDPYRVGMFLGLSGQCAPRVACAVTADWQQARYHGVQAATWWANLAMGACGQVKPFVRPAISRVAYAASPFRVAHADRELRSYRKPYSTAWLSRPASAIQVRLDALDAHERSLANIIARHPALHTSVLAELAGKAISDTRRMLDKLQAAQLVRTIQPDPAPEGWRIAMRPDTAAHKKLDFAIWSRVKAQPAATPHDLALTFAAAKPIEVRRIVAGLQRLERARCVERVPAAGYEDMWVADEALVRQRALEQGNDEQRSARRYGYFAKVMACHAQHTREAHQLLETICSYVRRKSRATFGARGREHCAVTTVGSECSHTRAFTHNEVKRVWRPDGFVAVRVNGRQQEFWIEMASFNLTREARSAEDWREKMDALCAYAASNQWRLTYLEFPTLLVVTHDLREATVAGAALHDLAKVHGLRAVPRAWMTTRRALKAHLILDTIWHDLVHDRKGTPFNGFASPASVVQRGPDLIDQLLRAEQAGVIDAAIRGLER